MEAWLTCQIDIYKFDYSKRALESIASECLQSTLSVGWQYSLGLNLYFQLFLGTGT